jgi:PAS domain S-box-containing protein
MPKAKIIIVEDEAVTAQDIKHSLVNLGYEVSAITDNGLDAINLAKQLSPDLIIMDITIKGPIDGIEAALKIGTFSKVPVVYLTANKDEEVIERSKATRPYGYLLKPLNERDLNSCLRMAFYRFQTENRLRESEARYFRLAENAGDIIFRLNLENGVYEYINKACAEITGYLQDDFYSNPLFLDTIIHPDWKKYYSQSFEKMKSGVNIPSIEYMIIHKDGKPRWLNQRNTLLKNENGTPAALEGIISNVTSQKDAEELLRSQREEYRLMFEAIPAMVLVKDTAGKILKANKLAAEYIGYNKQLEGKHIHEVFPGNAEIYQNEDDLILSTGKPLQNIVEEYEKAGHGKVWLTYDKYPYKNENGDIVGIIVMARDITEIENTRERLDEIQAVNKALVTSLPDLLFYMDKNGVIKDYKANNKDDLAIPPESFIGKKITELFPEKFTQKKKEIIKKAIETNQVQFFEYEMDINGELKDFEARYIVSGQDEILAIIRDITDKKRIEKALKESEAKYKNLTQNAPVAFTRLIIAENKYEIVNDEFIRQSGYTIEEFNNLSDTEYQNQIFNDDRQWVQTEFRDWIKQNCPGIKKLVYRIINKRGELIWLDSYHYADFDENGKPVAINQLYLNVNDRKQYEEILSESKQYLDAFFQQSLDGIFIAKMNTPVNWKETADRRKTIDFIFKDICMQRVNKSLCEQFGLPESDVMKIKPGEYYKNEELEKAKQRWEKFLDEGSSHTMEFFNKPDGEKVFIEGDYYCLYDSEKRFTGYIGIQRDITSRKLAEESIRLSEEKFRAVAESIPAQVVIFQGEKFIYVNPYSEVITGYTPEELLKKNFWDIVHKDYTETAKKRGIKRQKGEPVPDNYEMKIITKSGEEKWISYSARVIDFNNIPAVIGISIDITEKKNQQEEIFKSEERYRTFVEQSSEGIFRMEFPEPIPLNIPDEDLINRINTDAYFAECNNVFCKMYDAIDSSEIIGKGPDHLKYKNIDAYSRTKRFISNGYKFIEEETTETDENGNIFYFVVNAAGVTENGCLTRVWGVQRDVTEKRKAEEALKRSLVEKEILLKEIHHRVKNNLQIVTSLLKLQSNYVNDESVKALFKESQNRVHSMSLIHQKLYQTKDISHIDFKDYIDTVTNYLQHSFGILGDRVIIKTDANAISLSIDNAIPAGLIINELVSNSLKHAFADDKNGDIFISLAYDKFNMEYWLIVRDNGKGMPENFDFNNSKSFGLKLVYTLVKQMSGNIEIFSRNGTEFRVMFKSAEYKSRN